MAEQERQPIFRNLNADDSGLEATEIESLCLSCNKNGTTRLLLTKIPFFKEIIIMSFSCSHCGFSNNETQFGGKIQEKGVSYKVQIKDMKDLSRQLVKSDYAMISIPEVDLEIPCQTQKGEVTTIEGVITRVITGLKQDQETRKTENPDAAKKVEEFLNKLEKLKVLDTPFTLILDDPSGNSFIENPLAPLKDDAMEVTNYKRTLAQDQQLGLAGDSALNNGENTTDNIIEENINDEVLTFHTNCPLCNAPCETRMKPTKIPHFKEVVIMATNCESCGHRTNEVKSGSGIEPHGTRIKLRITHSSDFNRDVLKSETCSILIPELELEVGSGALGGRFTTVEGLLDNIKEQLQQENPFIIGDSADEELTKRMEGFIEKLDKVKSGEIQVHLILDDPAGNSYLQNYYAPDPDDDLEVSYYERTFELNEELGLNDMKIEDYEIS